jgi:hypothetical protein
VVLVDRDYRILRDIERFRFCLSRHIKLLASFEGQRACDRRLKILIETGYIDRKKVLYGVPSVYFLTYKGKMLIGANKRQDKIRVEKIPHDIAVVETAIYFMLKQDIHSDEIVTEKELNSKSGFGERKHCPDFIIEKDGKKNCVEIELSLKAKDRFEKIVENNYLEYETQFWIVAKSGVKIKKTLEKLSEKYTNIKIIELEGVQKFVRENK